MSLVFFVLVAMCFFLSKAQATSPKPGNAYISGHELKVFCAGVYDTDYGYCAGYVTAIADLMMEHRIYNFSACNMQLVKSEQLAQIVREFIQNNPDKMDYNARILVAEALSKAFPCFGE